MKGRASKGARPSRDRGRDRRGGPDRPQANAPPRVPPRARLHLDSLAYGGDAVGRDGGRVWFVPFGAPAETVVAEGVDVRSSYVRARLVDVVDAGPDRTEPRCVHFGDCGGCQWQHLTYAAQVREKMNNLRGALRRITSAEIADLVASPEPYQYRARAELHVEDRGRARALGYRRARSHEVVEPRECPVLGEKLEAVVRGLGRLVAVVAGAPVGRYELHQGAEGVSLCLHVERSEAAAAVRWLRRVLDEVHDVVACQVRSSKGPSYSLLGGRVSREGLGFSPGVFAQGHDFLAGALAREVVRLAAPARQRVLELYSGAGQFTIPLAKEAREVVAVEDNRIACEDLRENLAAHGVTAEVRVGRVAKLLPVIARSGKSIDVVVLDPPRRGAADDVEPLVQLRPRRIVYVSCDPMTLARDLLEFAKRGYATRAVRAFDLFPQTYHLETVCLLERESAPG